MAEKGAEIKRVPALSARARRFARYAVRVDVAGRVRAGTRRRARMLADARVLPRPLRTCRTHAANFRSQRQTAESQTLGGTSGVAGKERLKSHERYPEVFDSASNERLLRRVTDSTGEGKVDVALAERRRETVPLAPRLRGV
ncbi:unnamed protein product [Lampetra fluviatilis]